MEFSGEFGAFFEKIRVFLWLLSGKILKNDHF